MTRYTLDIFKKDAKCKHKFSLSLKLPFLYTVITVGRIMLSKNIGISYCYDEISLNTDTIYISVKQQKLYNLHNYIYYCYCFMDAIIKHFEKEECEEFSEDDQQYLENLQNLINRNENLFVVTAEMPLNFILLNRVTKSTKSVGGEPSVCNFNFDIENYIMMFRTEKQKE